jgi:hypothetical protein
MREEMRAEARGERREAILAAVLGLGAVSLAVQLWRTGSPHAAAGIPLTLLGLAQVAGAVAHFVAAGRRRGRLSVLLAQDPGRFQHQEIARVGHVFMELRFSLAFEALLLGVGATVAFAQRDSPPWLGVGLAMAGEGVLLLLLDAWSGLRTRAYRAQLQRFLTDEGARPTTTETGDVAHE